MMSPLVLLLVSLAVFITPSHAQNNCGLPYPPVASQNEQARPSRFPRQTDKQREDAPPSQNTVSDRLEYSGCGAVVISDRFLLTAAYCVIDPSKPVSSVRLGELDLDRDEEANSRPADYDIELIIIHPNFTFSPETQIRYSDLALLKTARTIQFNEAVFPLCISSGRPAPGTTVIASGYGHVNETHRATHLQEGELQVMSLKECETKYHTEGKDGLLRRAYPDLLQGHGVLCAGHPGRGACKGDEGGPLLREDASGRRYVEGILSFTGDECGPSVMPSISTSIADYFDFIRDTISFA